MGLMRLSWIRGRDATAGVHRGGRKHSGVGARGAGAAARSHTADRRAQFIAANDPESRARLVAFARGLHKLGWTDGRNDIRSSGGEADSIRRDAAGLVALAPDVILANGAAALGPLLQTTRAVPIVFVPVTDPVGVVDSLAWPGGNATAFTAIDTVDHYRRAAPYVDRILKGDRSVYEISGALRANDGETSES